MRSPVDRSSSQVGGSIRIARDIIRHDGTVAGLYRGFTPNVVGNSLGWAAFFLWYGKAQDALHVYRGSQEALSYYDHFLASGAAGGKMRSGPNEDWIADALRSLGLLTSLCTNPIWVIKTRMLSTSSKYPGAYTSILDGSRQIFRSEGLSGFYRGLIPSLVGVSHGAVFFAVYEPLKSWRASMTHGADASTLDTLITTTVGKIIAASATYPYQVVRARLQTYNAGAEYRGVRDTIEQIRRTEGFKGFYKGMGPGLARVLPSVWVTFLVAEKLKLAMTRGFLGGFS